MLQFPRLIFCESVLSHQCASPLTSCMDGVSHSVTEITLLEKKKKKKERNMKFHFLNLESR